MRTSQENYAYKIAAPSQAAALMKKTSEILIDKPFKEAGCERASGCLDLPPGLCFN